jgi:hypothetical protein
MTHDEIDITILEDGTLVVSTDQIGAANHTNADRMLLELARLMGSPVITTKRPHATQAHSMKERTHVHG